MARRLIVRVVVACAIAAGLAAYLRVVERHAFRRVPPSPSEGPQVGARESRAALVAAREEVRLQVARYRLLIEDSLNARAPRDPASLAVAVVAGGWGEGAATLRGALEGEWRTLGLSATKVAVGIVVIDRATARRWGQQLAIGANDPAAYYVPPDSLAPTTCLAVVVAPPAGRQPGGASLRSLARSWLGACAFYARFGIPGPRVARWLARRHLDLALTPSWAADTGDPGLRVRRLGRRGPASGWYWDMVYWMPPRAVRCLSGRAAACAAAVTEGDGGPAGPDEWVQVQSGGDWRYLQQRLTGGDAFLGAVARRAGPRRFLEFWRTSLPVDSALTLALGAPVGEWTAAWQGSIADRPRPGPALRWSDLVAAVLLALAAVGTVTRQARAREAL